MLRPAHLALLFAVTSALVCACKPTVAREPDLPLPADIVTLPQFDPASIGPGKPPWGAPPAPLAIVDVAPMGRHAWVREVHVRFNQAVVPQDLEAPDPTPLFHIEPPLAGRARWRAPDHLVFEPASDAVVPATRYTLRLTGPLRGQDGQPLADARTWTFETAPPGIDSVAPGYDEELATDVPVLLEFNQTISAAALAAHLEARAYPPIERPADDPAIDHVPRKRTAAGTRVPISVRPASKRDLIAADQSWRDPQPATLFAIHPASRWPGAREVELILRPGLTGERGPLPTDAAWATEFTTPHPQSLESMTCTAAAPCGTHEELVLRFRNDVPEDQLTKFSVSPRVADLEAHNYSDANAVTLTGEFRPGTTYTIRTRPGLKDSHGQTLRPLTRQAVFIHTADLELSATRGILPPGRPHVGLEAHHLQSVRLKLAVLDERELAVLDPGAAELPPLARTRELQLDLQIHDDTQWASHQLDLAALTAPLRPAGTPLRGSVLVEVTPLGLAAGSEQLRRPDPVRGLYHVTDLTLVAHTSHAATVVRATHLSSGTPAPGVAICHLGPAPLDTTCRPLGTTDKDGLLRASVPFPKYTTSPREPGDPPRERVRLVGHDRTTDDRAQLDILHAPFTSPYDHRPRTDDPELRPGERLIARLVRERGAYRPGERVHLVGWAALDTPHTRHNLATPTRGSLVEFTLQDSSKKIVARTTGRTTPAGKFTATLKLPADAKLGHYTAIASMPGGAAEAHLKVQDYRVPEFSATAAAQRSDILGDEPAVIDLDAAYFFGAPVALTDVTYDPDCRPIRYTPPNLEYDWAVGLDPLPYSRAAAERRLSLAAQPNDPPGRRTLRSVIPVTSPLVPHRCTLTFFAQDASAQGVGAEAVVTLHPAPIYLAIHPPAIAYRGDRLQIPLRALTRDGDRVAATAVELRFTRHWDEPIYKEEDGLRWQSGSTPRSAPLLTCNTDLTAAGPDAACELAIHKTAPTDSIELRATATIDGRVATTSTTFRVYDRPDNQPAPIRLDPPKALEIHPSKTTVRPGDRVEVVVRAPWAGARGQLVTARRGVHDVHPFVLDGQQATIVLTADDSWTPALDLVAHVITAERPNGHLRRHTAAATIVQDSSHRRLTVAVDAPRQAGPGDSLPITVSVRDPAGRPVAGRVAVWAVDEAVLSLTDEQLPDLLPSFLPAREREVDDLDVLDDLLYPYVATRQDPDTLPRHRYLMRRTARAPRMSQGQATVGSVSPGSPRSKFETTPLFLGDALVDATGTARVTATLPDNLTTFRVTALASADLADAAVPGRFGGAEARVVVTAPLVVRAAAPRQLRPGDTAELAALIDNRTGESGRVLVTADLLDATGPEGPALEFLSKKTAHIDLPAHGQARVAFEVRARAVVDARLDLRARFTPRGAAAPLEDAIRIALPVVAEPTLIDRAAVHGELTTDRAAKIPVKLPPGAQPGHGGLELRASTSVVAGLDDAARALVDYPYGCAEQTASRLLPLIALRGVHQPVPGEFAATTLARLASMQTSGGGFAYWPGDPNVHPYVSAYITWLLQRGSSVGLPVPEDMLQRALADLDRRVAAVDLAAAPQSVRADLGVPLALALAALADAGRDIDAPAAALFAARAGLPLFTRATLLLALHRRAPGSPAARTLAAELLANLSEGPDGAHAVELLPHNMDAYFHSDARTDAIVLLALLQTNPDHPSLAKLVRGLQQARPAGAWRNTQENAHAILALAEWSRVREPAAPDVHARVWLAGRTALDVPLRGRDAATTITAPMVDLLALTQKTDGLLPVVLHRQGAGTLYYRLGVDWSPGGPDLPARDQGLALTRSLRTTSGIDLGAPVAIDLTLRTHTRVRYVAVDIPIPAGLEPIQTDLGHGHAAATLTGPIGRWFTRQELHRDRILLFVDDLPPGHHVHTIHLRATSRGRYTFPPAHTEAMYIPEIYGRTTATTIDVR